MINIGKFPFAYICLLFYLSMASRGAAGKHFTKHRCRCAAGAADFQAGVQGSSRQADHEAEVQQASSSSSRGADVQQASSSSSRGLEVQQACQPANITPDTASDDNAINILP
ncbi:hypothetical protein DUNSADRAFT_16661 [Dunaliella salina]|uniref:Encoded protein n=1 Tax=Dunaliella salina TaxID=3046 RepID=A0ABQ7G346_DUNSA|nr:hypothetical protein DUNSADRAFT_16661 [Dunaliella salina]|eukprot:KAF5829027.1 hypothetical protein DUNSADRAFT_16661 [Dunaliella salina]